MRVASDVQYATTPDGASIAFQVVGDGPLDVVYAAGMPINGSALLDFPVFAYSQYLERIASFSRLAIFDPRGSGRSDPLPSDGSLSLDAQADELIAVIDAAGFERAVVIAEVNAGPAAIRLAAERPDRVHSLILNMTFASFISDGDYPGIDAGEFAERIELIVQGWGTGGMLGMWNPEVMSDERIVREMAQFELLVASPARVRALFTQWGENDARADLARVSVPTLVMHDRDNVVVPTELGRYLADHIPGAKYWEYPAPSEMPALENVLNQVAVQCEFITGSRAGVEADRILGVLLFLDVVESTERVLAHGDRGWRADVEALQRAARAEIGRLGARLVNTRGDDLFVLCPTPATAVRLACELRARGAELGLELRGGIHLAEVEDTGDDVLGLGVHVTARVCDRATAGEVWVTDPVRLALLGGNDEFEERGEHELKGIPGTWSLSAVADPEGTDRRVEP